MLGQLFIKSTFGLWRDSFTNVWRAVITVTLLLTFIDFVSRHLIFDISAVDLFSDALTNGDLLPYFFIAYVANLLCLTLFDVSVYQLALQNKEEMGYRDILVWNKRHWLFLLRQIMLLLLMIAIVMTAFLLSSLFISLLSGFAILLGLLILLTGLYFWFRCLLTLPAAALDKKITLALIFQHLKGKVGIQFFFSGILIILLSALLGLLFFFLSTFFSSIYHFIIEGIGLFSGDQESFSYIFWELPISFITTLGVVFIDLLSTCFLFVVFDIFSEEQGLDG